MQILSDRLRLLATRLSLKDAAIAASAGVPPRAYSHYVTGRNEPSLDTLLRICKALGVTPNDLLLENAEVSPLDEDARILRLMWSVRQLDAKSLSIAQDMIDVLSKHQG